eukprot:481124-Amphidinium_carterae.1
MKLERCLQNQEELRRELARQAEKQDQMRLVLARDASSVTSPPAVLTTQRQKRSLRLQGLRNGRVAPTRSMRLLGKKKST